MTTDAFPNRSYYLEPGYIYCGGDAATVHTVVGSCVAVCLWEPRLNIGGMNHFLLPVTNDITQTTARYGNVATLKLVKMMENAGASRKTMLAQILGGGAPRHAVGYTLGEENVAIARSILKRKGILITSEDVGGHMGRKIVFDTHSGHVMVLKVHRIRQDDWIEPPPKMQP